MDKNSKNNWWKPAVKIFGTVSVWIVIPILGALILGKHFDTVYGTKPFIFIGLSLVGFLISSFGIVRTITEYMKDIAGEFSDKNGITTDKK